MWRNKSNFTPHTSRVSKVPPFSVNSFVIEIAAKWKSGVFIDSGIDSERSLGKTRVEVETKHDKMPILVARGCGDE